MKLVFIFALLWVVVPAAWSVQPPHGSGRGKISQGSKQAREMERPGALDNLERLRAMQPAERSRILSSLPAGQRARIEDGISRLQQMDPAHRAVLLERYRRFQALSPAQKDAVRKATRQLQQLPAPRRHEVRLELNRLRNMPEQERQERLSNPDFQSRFSPAERDIIEKESAILPDS